MTFWAFIARRSVRFLLTLILVFLLVFLVLRVIPGDPALAIAGMDSSPEDVESIRGELGLDEPIAVQIARYYAGLARLDLGVSLVSGEKVAALIASKIPVTLVLASGAMVFALVLAIPLGVAAAVKRWSAWDYAAMAVSQIGMAVPAFWLGILLLLAFSVKLPLFPLFGADTPAHFVLPCAALGLGNAALLVRLTKTSMTEELSKDYVTAARARGLAASRVLYVHALRNAMFPVLTVSGIQLGGLLGGAIVVEQVFGIPGLGRLLLSAVSQRDFPVVQGVILFMVAAYASVNFLVDALYGALNPKVRAI